MHKFLSSCFVLLSALAFASTEAEVGGSLRMPQELEGIEIDDKAGALIPLDIALVDQEGRARTLKDYVLADGRPLVLTMGYFGCPMLCSLVLNGVVDVLKKINFTPGKDYRLVSISIDEREEPDLAKQKRAAYLTALDHKDENDFWNFHVTSKGEAKRLADALGFNYLYDQKSDQFAHGAGFFVISPNGVLSRTLYGINFKPTDMKLALTEASEGKVGSFLDRVILSCFHYDPDSHKYGIYVFGVMRLGGVLTVLILAMVLGMYFRAERKRNNSIV